MNESKKSSLYRLLRFLKPYGMKYYIGMICNAGLAAMGWISVAVFFTYLFDAITTGNKKLLWESILYFAIFLIILMIIIPCFAYLWRSSVQKVMANMRRNLFDHVQKLPLEYHEKTHSGNFLSILTNDLAAVERSYRDLFFGLFRSNMTAIGAIIVMMYLDWKLAVLIVLFGMAPVITNAFFVKPLRRLGIEIQNKMGIVSERLSDLLAGYKVNKAYNLDQWILGRFNNANDDLLDSSLKNVQVSTALAATNDFAGIFSLLSICFGGYLVLLGYTTFGIFIALTQLSQHIVEVAANTFGRYIAGIQVVLAATDRITHILDSEPEPDCYSRIHIPMEIPHGFNEPNIIEIKKLRFAYQTDQYVIKNVSLTIKNRQRFAFVGPSGSGKSTLLKLLMGFYPIVEGDIHVYGQSINRYRLLELRQLFSIVTQDTYLYTGSVIDNIRYGNPNASDNEVIEAAKSAYAHDFINAFPERYNSHIGEQGVKLSGGQRQRIAIARALLKNAPILLLDEATSALDAESEQLVQQALDVLMKNRTVLVIAHNLSTIKSADMIFAMNDGCIVEQGRHEELIETDGLYHYLYDRQFSK